MSFARRIWQDAKKKLTNPAAWEGRIGRDDLGPSLDKFDSMAEDLKKDIKSLVSDVQKLRRMIDQAHDLMDGYSTKIGRSDLHPKDKADLASGLNDTWDELLRLYQEADAPLGPLANTLNETERLF
jgi:predicted  nucleic acid-binding Zn-ribbon protein